MCSCVCCAVLHQAKLLGLCCLNKTILLLLLHIIVTVGCWRWVELSCYLFFAYCLDVNVWLWMNWLDRLSPSFTDTIYESLLSLMLVSRSPFDNPIYAWKCISLLLSVPPPSLSLTSLPLFLPFGLAPRLSNILRRQCHREYVFRLFVFFSSRLSLLSRVLVAFRQIDALNYIHLEYIGSSLGQSAQNFSFLPSRETIREIRSNTFDCYLYGSIKGEMGTSVLVQVDCVCAQKNAKRKIES